MSALIEFDTTLFLLINSLLTAPALDVFFTTITDSDFWIIPLIGGAIFLIWRRRLEGIAAVTASALTLGLADLTTVRIFKPLVGRLRPCHPDAAVAGGRFLLGMKGSFSFPSAHAANMFGLAVCLTWFYPRRWYWFMSAAFLIGYSRVYTGVHYPFDVAGGALLGAVIGTGTGVVALRIIQHHNRQKRTTVHDTSDQPPGGEAMV